MEEYNFSQLELYTAYWLPSKICYIRLWIELRKLIDLRNIVMDIIYIRSYFKSSTQCYSLSSFSLSLVFSFFQYSDASFEKMKIYLSFVDNRENVKDESSNSFVDTFILANFVGNFKKGMTNKTCQYKRHSSLNNFDILLPIFY